MIVPQYWAEGRIQHREPGKQITIRRFGWSDTSQADAQTRADDRTQAAFQRWRSGEKGFEKRERKAAYNGAVGVPIREEIVSRHGDTIITRNSYGARCLNTPNVFFADIDYEYTNIGLSAAVGCLVSISGCASVVAFWRIGVVWSVVFACLLFALGCMIPGVVRNFRHWMAGGPEAAGRSRIYRFLSKHPEWNLRIYRTPAGLRVMATHQAFSPDDPAVAQCFRAFQTDPLYVRMCLNQKCFRARVTAKPWRVGISTRMKPRLGAWPVAPERMPVRIAWIVAYEEAAQLFAACTFVESIGSGVIHQEVWPVQELHDELCRANSKLPIA